eukprot:TRINITY_DN214_c0_g2_i1.p1 TRINITY_DN214_c0_g2~~TRINITY_DN214_c0_g2_i1.p1  ORF type:complete len:283 (+),score=76.66 TRINITY_DN214_c0_g2_i1:1-849(+)
MEDMGVPVSQTALCEGDEVVIEPSRRFVAGQRLREMGVRLSNVDDLRVKVFESPDMTDEEKAGVVELMVECDSGFVHAVGSENRSALHRAASKGLVATMEVLVKHGAKIDQLDGTSSTPLCLASEEGHLEAVKELIRLGAALDLPNYYYRAPGVTHDVVGESPLYLAADEGHLDVVRVLIAAGADVMRNAIDNSTALHVAARQGHLSIACELISHGADVNHTNLDGHTPLYEAASEGYSDIVTELLSHGAVDPSPKGISAADAADDEDYHDIAAMIRNSVSR